MRASTPRALPSFRQLLGGETELGLRIESAKQAELRNPLRSERDQNRKSLADCRARVSP
jgi:hypothetical protein